MEVTIRLICIKDDFYIAVPESEYKLLKILKSTTYKNNSVIKSEIDRMLVNKGKIMMPTDQWKSYLGHVFFTDDDITSHKELRERVTMGAFIHHQAKTGARSGEYNDTDENSEDGDTSVQRKPVTNYDKDVADARSKGKYHRSDVSAEKNSRLKRIAVGADSKMYIGNILLYLSALSVSISLYLNTQTGSLYENENTKTAIFTSVREGFQAVAKCVTRNSNPQDDELASNTLNNIVSSLFVTPFHYAQGNVNAMIRWNEIGQREREMRNSINEDNVDKFLGIIGNIDVAKDFVAFRGMPLYEIEKYLTMPDDMPYNDDLNDSAEIVFSYFPDVQQFYEAKGEFGTNHSYGELLNGRSIHNLLSYANVWNDFRKEHFLSKIGNVLFNLLYSRNDSAEGDEIRRQTIITLGILTIMSFPFIMQASSAVRRYRMDKTKADKIEEHETNKDEHYEKRREKKVAEYLLDMFEMMEVALLLFTASIEFIGITNIVGTSNGMDIFLSQSYSTNWYYMASLGTIMAQPHLRTVLGTESRHPNRIDIAAPARVAMDLVIASIAHDPTSMLKYLLGADMNTDMGKNSVFGTQILISGYLLLKIKDLVKYVHKSHMGTHALTGVLIDMHANMLRDGKTSDSKMLRDRLLHNDTFRRNVITQLCAI
jgi:hypothetical protein